MATSNAAVIANHRNDFVATSAPNVTANGSWSYLWNAPFGWTGGALTGAPIGDITTSPLSDTTSFKPLQPFSANYLSADGDNVGNDSNPDRFIRISRAAIGDPISLHPGAQAGFNVGMPGDVNGATVNSHDRFVITSFTVNSTATYSIVGGSLTSGSAMSNGVDVFAFATGQSPVLLGASVGAGGAFTFSQSLGVLNANDTIYVAFGTNGNAGNDASFADFSIDAVAVPEPSIMVLSMLTGVGVFSRRRFQKRLDR